MPKKKEPANSSGDSKGESFALVVNDDPYQRKILCWLLEDVKKDKDKTF